MVKQAVGRPWDPDAPRVPQGIAPALRQGPLPEDQAPAPAAWTPKREDFESLESVVGDLLGQVEKLERRLRTLWGTALRPLHPGDRGEANALEVGATHRGTGSEDVFRVVEHEDWEDYTEDVPCAHHVKRRFNPAHDVEGSLLASADHPDWVCVTCGALVDGEADEADRPKKKRRRSKAHDDEE